MNQSSLNKSLSGLLLLACTALAGWEVVPSGTTNALFDVAFITPGRGYAIGGGVLLATSDSGKTWSKDSLAFSGRAISFADSAHGLIGGGAGNIHWTEDGGQTWHKAATPDTGAVVSLVLFADGSGYANGNRPEGSLFFLWKTSDQGKTWTLLDTSWSRIDAPEGSRFTLSGSQFAKFCFPSRNIGYLVQRLATLKTTDGGATWRIAKHMTQDSNYLNTTFMQSCHFMNDSVGIVTGSYYSAVGRTTNGMRTVQKNLGPGGGVDMFFSTPAIGYTVASGVSYTIRRTSDSGATWTDQSVPSSGISLNKVVFTDPNRGIAVGSKGVILRTTDGGGSPVTLSPTARPTIRPRVRGLFGRMVDALGRTVQGR